MFTFTFLPLHKACVGKLIVCLCINVSLSLLHTENFLWFQYIFSFYADIGALPAGSGREKLYRLVAFALIKRAAYLFFIVIADPF